MQFKLFGPGNLPEPHFQRDLGTFLSLQAEQWQAIADWFLSTEDFSPEDSLSNAEIVTSTLLPQQFIASAALIRYILESWHKYELDLVDIQRDLLLLGRTSEEIDRVGEFLKPLEQIKGRVFGEHVRTLQEDAVLPTLYDVNIVCDVRAIFEDLPYPAPDGSSVRHTRLLEFRPVVLMEILTEDFFRRKQKLSFQMNEEEFVELYTSLRRAHEQLDLVKAKTATLSKDSK